MGSGSVVVFRAVSLSVVALAGIVAVVYITRHEGGVRDTVFPRAATTTPANDCKDHLIHGLHCSAFPDVCKDPFGREVCQQTCNVCGTGTTTPDPGECKDHVDSEVTCAGVPGFCADRFAVQLCPKYCGLCPASSSSAKPTPQHHSTVASTSPSPPCVDHVGNGFHCGYLPGLCTNLYGHLLCRLHCGECTPGAGGTTPPSGHVTPGACVDYVVGDFSCQGLNGICSDAIGRVLCPRHCGACTTTATTTTAAVSTTEPPCVDHLIHGKVCGQIPGICNNMYGHMVCRRHCTGCASSSTPAHNTGHTAHPGMCMDYVGNGLRCKDLPNICQDHEQFGPKILCPKTCGQCHHQVTTPTPALTQPPSLDSCHDHLIHDTLCSTLTNNACHNTFLKVFCPRHCQQCVGQGGPNVVLQQPPAGQSCYDMVGAGFTCQLIPGVCADPEASVYCPVHCGTCPSTTTAGTTTTKPTHPHNHHHTSPSATATTSTKAPGATATTKPAMGTSGTTSGSSSGCQDNLGNGLSCASYANACGSAFAMSMCPKTCNLCGQTTSANAAATSTTTTHPSHGHSSHGSGHASTSAPTAGGGSGTKCKDNVASTSSMDCQTLKANGFCSDQFSENFCRKTCGYCTDSMTTSSSIAVTSPAVCEDLATTCNILYQSYPNLCNDTNGKRTCPKFCGLCNVATTTTVGATSSPTSSSSACKPRFNDQCKDEAEDPICRLPDICHKDIAQVVCKKTCHFCEAGCYDRLRSPTKCSDLYGVGKPVGTLKELCAHPLGLQQCEASCDCPGYCPLTTTASSASPATTTP